MTECQADNPSGSPNSQSAAAKRVYSTQLQHRSHSIEHAQSQQPESTAIALDKLIAKVYMLHD
jgi:hypothetical protein